MNIAQTQIIPLDQLQTSFYNEENDEESNNGPLDFSLHRTVVTPGKFMKNCAQSIKYESVEGKPKIKLTQRETSDQRARRLEKGRERMRKLRSNETLEERTIRLLKARECQERRRRRERELETHEEREKRLTTARDRTRMRRHGETPEQREKRLRTTRERLRLKRMSESPDERQKRLNALKEKKRQKYHYLTSDDNETYRSRKPKLNSDIEKRQTRGISFKYDLIDEELDEALMQFSSHDDNCTGKCDKNLPKEQISEKDSSLVMTGNNSCRNFVTESFCDQISENKTTCELHNSQLQRDFRDTDCSNYLQAPPVENSRVKFQNDLNQLSETDKDKSFHNANGSRQVPQFSSTDLSVSQLLYERSTESYNCTVSSASATSQMHSSQTHNTQEISIENHDYNHLPHTSETLQNSAHYPQVAQFYNEIPLNLHQPSFLFHRFPLPLSSSPKDDAVYLNYESYQIQDFNRKTKPSSLID